MTTTPSDPSPPPPAPPAAHPAPAQSPVRSRRPGPLLTTGIPLGFSLALHACLLMVAAAIVWQVASHAEPARRIPVSVVFDAPGQSPEAPAPDTAPPESEAASPPSPPSPAIRPPVTTHKSEPAAAPDLAGLSTSGAPAGPVAAPAIGASVLHETESLALGAAVRTDPIRFAGLGAATARSVVYVVDGSGPMVSTMEIVLEELVVSVSRLGPSQKFGVVIFRRAPGAPVGYEWFTPALVRATPDAVHRLRQWLATIKPRGASNPLDGLRAAFTMKPEAIFLLSRSIERSGGGVWQLGLENTLRELDRLNPHPRGGAGARPVVIKTIQFLDEDPSGIMQAIGRLHGGAAAGQDASGGYTVIRRAADLRTANDDPGATAAPAAAPE